MKKQRQTTTRRRSIGAIIMAAAGILLLSIGFISARSLMRNEDIVINGIAVPPPPPLQAANVAQGERLYQQYCSSCHGGNLEGAPNWKQPLADGALPAPPHDSSGHTWHHEDELLVEIITRGSAELYDGTMPAFGEQLSRAEIEMILDYIKSEWGREEREYQWWVTAQR